MKTFFSLVTDEYFLVSSTKEVSKSRSGLQRKSSLANLPAGEKTKSIEMKLIFTYVGFFNRLDSAHSLLVSALV